MSKLTAETIALFDKVYNLRGSDSTILVEMEREIDENANSYEETSNIHQGLEETIAKLNNDIETLSDQGERLKSVLNGVDEKDYEKLLETLKVDFHPEEIIDKLNSLLPITVNGLVNDVKMSSNELARVEDKLQEIRTRMEELSIRKEEALVNQDRLNRYFDLALNSSINVTREELTNLFSQFNLSEDESRECAKLLMFPEDGLFEYEQDYKNAPRDTQEKIKEEISEDNEIVIEPIETNEAPITYIDADEFDKEDNIETTTADELLENNEVVSESVSSYRPSTDEVAEYLTSLGFDALDFTTNDLERIADNYNKELIASNVNTIKDMGINIDVFADNVELFYDSEMKSKIDKLTEVGKLPQDIYLNPSVLTKYNLVELGSAIKVLEDSGLEPKNVPLMAY